LVVVVISKRKFSSQAEKELYFCCCCAPGPANQKEKEEITPVRAGISAVQSTPVHQQQEQCKARENRSFHGDIFLRTRVIKCRFIKGTDQMGRSRQDGLYLLQT
jgi:hypothetical protein